MLRGFEGVRVGGRADEHPSSIRRPEGVCFLIVTSGNILSMA